MVPDFDDPENPEDELLPHEQDDPDVSNRSIYTTAFQGTQSGLVNTITGQGVNTTAVNNSVSSALRSIRVITEGGKPEVSYEDESGDLILTMCGGREVLFASTSGAPVYVDGNQRRFRLSKEDAQELTRKLARILASNAD